MQYFLDKLKEFLVFLVFSRLVQGVVEPCSKNTMVLPWYTIVYHGIAQITMVYHGTLYFYHTILG